MKLLGRKTSGNVQKVMWLLGEMKMPYEREDVGRQFNNTQTPEYLAKNPNAKVPTLVVTRDAALDNVVAVRLTEEYVRMWPHAERVTLERTGHIGLITRPDASRRRE